MGLRVVASSGSDIASSSVATLMAAASARRSSDSSASLASARLSSCFWRRSRSWTVNNATPMDHDLGWLQAAPDRGHRDLRSALSADKGSHVADGAEVSRGVDHRLDKLADVLCNFGPGSGYLGLVVASKATHIVRGHRRILDDYRPGSGRADARHREGRTELGRSVLGGERGTCRRTHPPSRRADPGGPLDQVAQRSQVPAAGGDRYAGTSWRKDPAQFADRGAAVPAGPSGRCRCRSRHPAPAYPVPARPGLAPTQRGRRPGPRTAIGAAGRAGCCRPRTALADSAPPDHYASGASRSACWNRR